MKRFGPSFLGALLLASCGGGGGGGGASALAFAGTLTVTSASPGGACDPVKVITFSASGADIHTVSLTGGGCLRFVNTDAAQHQPESVNAGCTQLNGPILDKDQSFTTTPFSGPSTCQWQDALHPLPAGGGGGY